MSVSRLSAEEHEKVTDLSRLMLDAGMPPTLVGQATTRLVERMRSTPRPVLQEVLVLRSGIQEPINRCSGDPRHH